MFKQVFKRIKVVKVVKIKTSFQRALIYIPKSNRIIGQPIYSHPINLLKPEEDKTLSNYTLPHTTQILDNSKLDNGTDSEKPINQLEVIDLEHEELEIIE